MRSPPAIIATDRSPSRIDLKKWGHYGIPYLSLRVTYLSALIYEYYAQARASLCAHYTSLQASQCIHVDSKVYSLVNGSVSDQLDNGRRFRLLNAVDNDFRERVGQFAAFSILYQQVARFLNDLDGARRMPDQIICDNGTGFTCRAIYFSEHESRHYFGGMAPASYRRFLLQNY